MESRQKSKQKLMNAVLDAIIGESSSGRADCHLDLELALEASTSVMAMLVFTYASKLDGKAGADMLKEARDRLASQLDYLADQIRDGHVPDGGPRLRLVK